MQKTETRIRQSRSEGKRSKNMSKQKTWRKEEKNLYGKHKIEAVYNERE